MHKEKATISSNLVLNFAEPITFFETGGIYLAVSEKRGNWLRVTASQKEMLNKLRSGISIGEALSAFSNQQPELRQLLAQILARNFCQISPDEPLITTPSVMDSVYLYLTYKCNLKCTHCYMYKAKTEAPLLTRAEYFSLLENLKAEGVKSITLSGGEPLLSPLFVDIVKKAKELGMSITVLSNGTLWTKEVIQIAKEYVDEVQISVDGIDETTCSLVRGHGVFKKATETAIVLANNDILTSIATTPVLDNIHEIERRYVEFTKQMSLRSHRPIIFRISSKLLQGRACGATSSFTQKVEHIADQIYIDNKLKTFAINHSPNCGLKSCGWGSLTFTPDGLVFPCNRVTDCLPLGNIRTSSLNELRQTAQQMNIASSVENTIPCRSCALKYLCGGGCRLDEFEKISAHTQTYSVRKCKQERKEKLLTTMSNTTKYLYKF